MKLRLDKIQDEPFSWQEDLRFRREDLDRPELAELSPLSWQGRLSRLEQGFYLQGTFTYRQTLQCDRCLEPFEQSIEDRLDLLVVEGPPPGGPSEHHLQAEDLGVVYVEDHELDTEPLLFEQVQINIPMKPLCRPECAGLCPHCGADLNAGACSCAEETDDTRWAALATLRDRLS